MNFENFKQLALRTEKPLPSNQLRLQHASLGITTEGGEFATEVKRMWAYEKPLVPSMREHMLEELGDILWYVAIGADAIDCDIPEIQYLFGRDFPSLLVPNQLELVTRRIAVENGFLTFEIVNYTSARSRESIMRGLVNIVSAVAHACDALDVSIEQVMAGCIEKLRQRFPDAYSNAAAEARADKGGLDAGNS